ncbi:hypothetical protein ONE63_000142 [Megalurothrips usitatus]|uniref:Uncharacterized protein n=1 Tax=Megalurothrips usitatus TaxID=439358 RepID=A0AAV7Y0Z9_9NEOP|nr:hypothetical protein ONE63_000142 [Megalurothrips usitatus]
MEYAGLANNPMNFTENQHGNVILEKLRMQKDSGRFCDVTLYVEGKQFKAHRNVLASCSSYFDTMLKMQRIVKEHLTITCKSSEVFQCLLNYMYTGSVVIDKENVCELVRLSNHFVVPKLKNYCSEYLERYLEVSNCVSVREMADKYSMPSLLKYSTNFIKNHIDEVMKQKELLDAPIALVEAFLSDDAWSVPQNSLLPFVTHWVSQHISGREQHTRKLLTFVDWSAMDQQAITEHVDRDPLYPQSEVALFAVLQALLSNNLLFNKYQIVYESLHGKFSQGSSNSKSLVNNSEEGSADVKEEAPSPGSPGPNVKQATESDHFLLRAKKSKTTKRTSGEGKTLDEDRDEDDDAVGGRDPDITYEGRYSEDSSDDERLMKGGSDHGFKGFEVDEGFSKEEPVIDIKVDMERSVRTGGDDEDEEDDDDEEEDDDDDDDDDDGSGIAEDLSASRDSDGSLSESLSSSGRKALSRTRSGGIKKRRSRTSTLGRSSMRLTSSKGNYPPGSARRGRPPGTGKKQREAAAAAAAAAAMMDEEMGVTLDGEERLAVKKLKCKQCKFRASDEAELETHVNDVHQGTVDIIYKCSECEFSCGYIKDYYKHLKKHFPGPPFKCDNCDYQCEKMVNLVAHRSKTCDDKPHHCTMCDYKCRSRPYLLVHMRSHTGELPYKCDTCGRAYAMRSTLEQHLTSHSKEQPYLCDACGFATKYIAHLMAHKRIHTGDVHRCTFPDCKYSTPKKSQLLSHARTHEGVRPHTCHICGRGFLEKSHLVRHERIHLDDKPFKCDHCDYASSRRDKLKEHYTRHHGDNASARVPYKARMSRVGDPRKGDNDVGDDFNADNASSTQSSNHGMNLSSSGGVGGAIGSSGEVAELLLAHSMTQQHLKYATSFAGLGANDGHMNMDYHHQQQHQQMHSNARLLAGVSNGDTMHAEAKDALLGQAGTIPAPPSAHHHMHQSAAAMAAMMLDGRVGYHQSGVSYGPGAMSQLPSQSSTQASDYPTMSLF